MSRKAEDRILLYLPLEHLFSEAWIISDCAKFKIEVEIQRRVE